MSKNNKRSKEQKISSQEAMTRAENAVSSDNQNINQSHNTKKESLGRNTKR